MSIVRAKLAGDAAKRYTRDQIIEDLKLYAELYGPDFTTASFNPSVAKWRDRPELVDRYYQGKPNGDPWPSLNQIKDRFGGSFNAARVAAGLPANRPGPVRRAQGEHQPIRDVRVQRVVVHSDERLLARLDRAVARAERAERLLAERRVRPAAKITKTVTKTVTKRDERLAERLRVRADDEKTRRVAAEDQVKAAVRDRDAALRAAEKREVQLDGALTEARAAAQEAKRLRDRLAVTEQRIESLRGDLAEQASMKTEVQAAAAIADRVRAAERRVDAAELRAARAEREMVEQAQAVTGEQRRLTAAEMAELRRDGPAGPKVLGDALKNLARARVGRGRLADALTEVASAALMWRDRL